MLHAERGGAWAGRAGNRIEALRDLKTQSDARLAAVEAENKRLRAQLDDLQRAVNELAARTSHN